MKKKDESGLYNKSKSSKEISNSSNSENPKDFNFSDIKIHIIENKNIPLGLNYFLCKENNLKKKFKKEITIKENPKII